MKKLLLLALFVLPVSLCAQKFAHFNSQEILQALPEAKTAQEELQKLSADYDKELQGMREEGQRKLEAYQAQRDSLPDNIRQRREQELQELQNRLQQTAQNLEQEFENARIQKLQAVNEKVMKAVQAIGEAGDYVYIMDVAAGIPFINKKLSKDITEELKKKLGI